MQERKDYYVYIHRRNDNNNIFYVGKGSGPRAHRKHSTGRSKEWKNIVSSAGGFNVEIIISGLSNLEALEKEKETIKEFSKLYPLCNSSVYGGNKDYNSIDWASEVFYDPESPSYLTRKHKNRLGNLKVTNKQSDSSYYIYYRGNSSYYVHRIIWILHNGPINIEKVINHIDGDGGNNCIDNLEEITVSENVEHAARLYHHDNSGIFYIKYKNNSGAYVAYVTIGRKRYKRHFPILRYGLENALKEAKEYRKFILENKTEPPKIPWRMSYSNVPYLSVRNSPSAGKIYLVTYMDEGKSRIKSFHTSKHGEDGAYSKATEFWKIIYGELPIL